MPNVLPIVPRLYDEQTNKTPLRCPKTPRKEEKKSSDLKNQPANEDTISQVIKKTVGGGGLSLMEAN